MAIKWCGWIMSLAEINDGHETSHRIQRNAAYIWLYIIGMQPLCPRCGADTEWIPGTGRFSYCKECGWNLGEVYRRHHQHDRLFAWLLGGLAALVCVPVIVINPRQGLVMLASFLLLGCLIFVGTKKSKMTARLKGTVDAVAQKPGVDLSSAAPDVEPRRVAAYGNALRSIPRPRQVRLGAILRAGIVELLVLAGLCIAVAIWVLLFPHRKPPSISEAVTALVLAALAILGCISLRKEARLNLLVNGDVVMARMKTIPAWWQGERLTFEFRDATSRLIRGQSANHGHAPAAGTYVPVFYDPQNPQNCAPACALNYDLVLPPGFTLT